MSDAICHCSNKNWVASASFFPIFPHIWYHGHTSPLFTIIIIFDEQTKLPQNAYF